MKRKTLAPTPFYALIQGLYWAIYCLMVSFASVFLLDRGFSNSEIGGVLGLSYLFSALLQPLTGAAFSRGRVRLNRAIAMVYLPVAVLSAAVRFLPLGKAAIAAMMVMLFTVQSMMQPSINALSQYLETPEKPVNFSLARGVGSAAYALSSFVMGRLLAHFSPSVLPVSYGLAAGALIVLLWFAPINAVPHWKSERKTSYREILREVPSIALFLAGVCAMFLAYSFIDSFLLQIIVSKGGSSGHLGTAITISAMTELPAMLLFAGLCRKGKGLKVFRLSIFCWLAKDLLTLAAPSPQALYAVQLLNFASCAVYVPGMMEYMRHTLREDQLLRGVTMAGTAATLGSLTAALAGGWLIDRMGVHQALTLVQGFAAAGTVLLTIALTRALRQGQRMPQ